MNNPLYQMMIRNAAMHLRKLNPNQVYKSEEDIPVTIWQISEVLAVVLAKTKEDIVIDIINCKID